MHKPPSKTKLQRIVDRFNREFPVGSMVLLRKDSGEVETVVRARAKLLEGHSAVAFFSGVTGCYSIEDHRVRAIPEPAASPAV